MAKHSARVPNPADAHRRAERKKEIKKNKADRKQVRLITSATKDVRKLESELAQLRQQERDGNLEYKSQLRKKEIQDLLKKKQDAREKLGLKSDTSSASASAASTGPLIRPEESPYYHPVYNPFGAPPPGATVPVKGNQPTPHERPEEEKSEEGSEEEDTSDEDHNEDAEQGEKEVSPFADLTKLPMPKNPPPDKEALVYNFIDAPETRNRADYFPSEVKPVAPPVQQRPFPPPPAAPPFYHNRPPPPFFGRPPYPPQPGFYGVLTSAPPYYGTGPPPPFLHPPPGFPIPIPGNTPYPYPYPPIPPPVFTIPTSRPLPPPAITAPPIQHTHPPPPTKSAAPVVRDLQKELTRFVPPSLLRKRNAPTTTSASGKVDLAPKVGDADEVEELPVAKKVNANTGVKGGASVNSDYDKFIKEMEGLL